MQRVLADVGPRVAQVVAQERQPLPQDVRVGRPPQQPQPILAEPFEEGLAYEDGVGVPQGPYRELDRPEPLHPACHDVPVGPVHLLALGVQGRGRRPGGVLVDHGGELHPRVPLSDGPVRHGHGDPGRAPQRGAVGEFGAGAGGHEIGARVGPGDPLGEGERGDETVVARARPGELRRGGAQPPYLRPPPSRIGVTTAPSGPYGGRQVVAVLARRLLRQQRDRLGARPGGVQQRPSQPGMQAQAGQPRTPGGRPSGRVHRSDSRQHLPRGGHRPARRRIQQGEAGRVRIAPAGHLQRERRQVGHLDLRRRETRQAGILGLRPAPVHRTRRLPPGPAGPLPSGGLRGPHRGERAQPARVVDARLPREPRVDDHPHARHGQGRLGHGGREHHPTPFTDRQHRVLHGRRRPPVHLQHLDVPETAQLPGHARDLAHARQEAQHVPRPLGQRPPYDRRDVRELRGIDPHAVRRAHRTRRRRPHDLHRMRDALRLHHGGVAQQPRPALGVGRRGRGHQAQLRPQGLPYVPQERGRRVRVQMPFVALVEHHRVHARQFLVALEPLEQHARGDDLHARVASHHPLAAHGVADARADLLAQQPRHPPGRRAGGDTAGLGDDDLPRGCAGIQQTREHQRDEGRLAGARRCHEDRRAVPLQSVAQRGQGAAYGKGVQGVVTDHAPSVVRTPEPLARQSRSHTKIALPGIRLPRSGDQPPHSEVFQTGHSGSTRSTRRKPPATTSRTRSPIVRWCST